MCPYHCTIGSFQQHQPRCCRRSKHDSQQSQHLAMAASLSSAFRTPAPATSSCPMATWPSRWCHESGTEHSISCAHMKFCPNCGQANPNLSAETLATQPTNPSHDNNNNNLIVVGESASSWPRKATPASTQLLGSESSAVPSAATVSDKVRLPGDNPGTVYTTVCPHHM